MKTTKIYGPPGTGKTTTLLNMIEEDLKTHHPSQIAFISFTKKAQEEGVNRAVDKFDNINSEKTYRTSKHYTQSHILF